MNTKQTIRPILGIILGAVLAISGIVLLVVYSDYAIFGKTSDLRSALEQENVRKDTAYTFSPDFVIANYAETEHKIEGFIPAGKDQHYAVVFYSEDKSYIVPVKVHSKKDIEYLESFTEDAKPAGELTGMASTINAEIEGYYEDMLSELEVPDYVQTTYIEIDVTQTRLKTLATSFFAIIAGLAVIMGILKRPRS